MQGDKEDEVALNKPGTGLMGQMATFGLPEKNKINDHHEWEWTTYPFIITSEGSRPETAHVHSLHRCRLARWVTPALYILLRIPPPCVTLQENLIPFSPNCSCAVLSQGHWTVISKWNPHLNFTTFRKQLNLTGSKSNCRDSGTRFTLPPAQYSGSNFHCQRSFR